MKKGVAITVLHTFMMAADSACLAWITFVSSILLYFVRGTSSIYLKFLYIPWSRGIKLQLDLSVHYGPLVV